MHLRAVMVVILLGLVAGCQKTDFQRLTLHPSVETEAVEGDGDAADDAAVWVHPTRGEDSVILGTQKQSGLYVYALDGRVRQFLPVGRVNNVDLRQGVQLAGRRVDLAAASNRSHNGIDLFIIESESGQVSELKSLPIAATSLSEVYGFCMGHVRGELLLFLATGKGGNAELFRYDAASNRVVSERVLPIDTQAEGCVIDDTNGDVFIGEEEHAVWQFNYFQPHLKKRLIGLHSGAVVADIEGLALLHHGGARYLMLSSQGNDRFTLVNTTSGAIAAVIEVAATDGIDAVSGTDGIEISQRLSSAQFPDGVLVVQDDVNSHPAEHQNFKLVSLSALLRHLPRRLY